MSLRYFCKDWQMWRVEWDWPERIGADQVVCVRANEVLPGQDAVTYVSIRDLAHKKFYTSQEGAMAEYEKRQKLKELVE